MLAHLASKTIVCLRKFVHYLTWLTFDASFSPIIPFDKNELLLSFSLTLRGQMCYMLFKLIDMWRNGMKIKNFCWCFLCCCPCHRALSLLVLSDFSCLFWFCSVFLLKPDVSASVLLCLFPCTFPSPLSLPHIHTCTISYSWFLYAQMVIFVGTHIQTKAKFNAFVK